jgi:hypothetical protein
MTSEDQDAIVGRTIRELRDVNEKIAKLKSRLSTMGDSFTTVSHHLRNKPELLRFDRESTEERFVERREDWKANRGAEPHIPSKDDLDIAKVIAFRDEIRQYLLEKERLEESLKAMGYGGNL